MTQPSHFNTALAEAHAITIAHNRGCRSVPVIALRTGLSITTVAEWVELLKLPTTGRNTAWRNKVSVATGGWVTA